MIMPYISPQHHATHYLNTIKSPFKLLNIMDKEPDLLVFLSKEHVWRRFYKQYFNPKAIKRNKHSFLDAFKFEYKKLLLKIECNLGDPAYLKELIYSPLDKDASFMAELANKLGEEILTYASAALSHSEIAMERQKGGGNNQVIDNRTASGHKEILRLLETFASKPITLVNDTPVLNEATQSPPQPLQVLLDGLNFNVSASKPDSLREQKSNDKTVHFSDCVPSDSDLSSDESDDYGSYEECDDYDSDDDSNYDSTEASLCLLTPKN